MDFRKLSLALTAILLLLAASAFFKSDRFDHLSSSRRENRKSNLETSDKKSLNATALRQLPVETTLRDIHVDKTTLAKILKDADLFEQANLWNGKLLFVTDKSNSSKHRLQYYHYNSLYQDTNNNNIQDPLDEGFFNPASTVKVGLVALVLEKLNEIGINRGAEYRIAGSQDWHSFEKDIRSTLIVSDNDATNRLILWLGFDRINASFRRKGLSHIVIDRLMLDQGTLVSSPAFDIRSETEVMQQQRQTVTVIPECYEIGSKVGNCSTATDLIEGLVRIVQPEYYSSAEGFNIRENDRAWVKDVMSRTPNEEGFDYEDNYCRFLTDVEKRFAGRSGKMLSKCGVSLFTNTYTDLSYLKTDLDKRYYILLSVSPPRSVSEEAVLMWMNQVAETILVELPQN